MRLWSTSADVSEEGFNKQPAMQQAPPVIEPSLSSADEYTGLPQASSLFVSLPFRRAIARLVPSVCGILPPREGGLHVRLTHCIIAHAMAKQLPLS